MDFLPFTRPTIDEETIQGVAEVLRSGWITSGPQVLALEEALSAYLGGRPVRTLTSATGALEVALQACGIGPGDEVITPALSFTATPNVIMRVGARPVFVDSTSVRNVSLTRWKKPLPRKPEYADCFAGLPVDGPLHLWLGNTSCR